MNWEAIGAVAEVLAALAVLVTLIYLALQVRQSNLQGRIQIQNNVTQHLMPALREPTNNPEYAALLNKLWNSGEQLNEIELIRIRAYVQHQMFVFLNMYLWSDSLQDDQLEKSSLSGISTLASASGLIRKMMLQEAEKDSVPDEFKKMIRDICAGHAG